MELHGCVGGVDCVVREVGELGGVVSCEGLVAEIFGSGSFYYSQITLWLLEFYQVPVRPREFNGELGRTTSCCLLHHFSFILCGLSLPLHLIVYYAFLS